MYQEVVPLCRRSEVLIREVFTNPDQVMGKFVLNIFQGQLQVRLLKCYYLLWAVLVELYCEEKVNENM